jgi:hypothetical protein
VGNVHYANGKLSIVGDEIDLQLRNCRLRDQVVPLLLDAVMQNNKIQRLDLLGNYFTHAALSFVAE